MAGAPSQGNGYAVWGSRFGVINVKDYGAVGDGSHDDTVAVQEAVDAVPATGGTVYFPNGVYKISSAISSSKPYLRLVGDGDGSIIELVTSGVDAFTLSGTNCTVDHLHIRYAGSTASTSGAMLHLASGANWAHVSSIRMDNSDNSLPFYNGLQQDKDAAYLMGADLNILFCANACISLNENEVRLERVLAQQGTTTSGSALSITGTSSYQLSSMSFSDMNLLQALNVLYTSYANDLFFSNCFFDSGAECTLRNGSNLQFVNCWWGEHTDDSCSLVAITQSRFSNCVNIGAGQAGFALDANCNNDFFSNCDVNAAGGSGYTFASGAIQCGIIGGRVSACSQYGVVLNSNDMMTVQGVMFEINTSGPISGVGPSQLLMGNPGYNPVGLMSETLPASGTAYTNASGVRQRIFLTGGTMSALSINGTDTGITATPANFELDPDETFTATYSSAPSLKVFGL